MYFIIEIKVSIARATPWEQGITRCWLLLPSYLGSQVPRVFNSKQLNSSRYGQDSLELEGLSFLLEKKPSREGGSVMCLVLQVYFWDHTGSLDNDNMDTPSGITNYHL